MPNDIASQAKWFLNSSRGNVKLRRLQTVDEDDDGSVEAVNEIGSTAPVGFIIKPGAKPLTLNFRETKGARPDVDWHRLNRTKEVCALTKQIEGGLRIQYPEIMVSKVKSTGNSDGEHTYTVECVALERQPL